MNADAFFGDMFLSEDLSDVRVIVENKTTWNFPAHSFVLKRRSPVFRKMLESDLVEGHSKTITITDFKATHVKQFFKFLYTETLPETYASLCELLKLSEKYLVESLEKRCEEALLDFVNFQNIFELCNLADMYSLEKLREKCLSFIKMAAFKLLKSDELECLSKEAMKDMVSADDLNVSSEMEVFRAIWKWGNSNICYENGGISNENIVELIKDLLTHVRWNLVSNDEKEKIQLLGIAVDDSDLNRKVRNPTLVVWNSSFILNHCDVINLDDFSASCTFIENAYKGNSQEVCFLRLVSWADIPFYVVGLVFTCSYNGTRSKLICRCESLTSVAEINDKNSKIRSVKINSVDYIEVTCEFLKPVEVCKNQTLTVNVKCGNYVFHSVELKFDQNVIRGEKGRNLCIEGATFGIRKFFLL